MKVLLVHNDYGRYSGEEAVVDGMVDIFTTGGHEVAQLRTTTAGLRDTMAGKVRAFVAGIHCPSGVRAMREALLREKPDVVNVHNLYPFISPAALRECRRAGVPVIMTVHNYRLICPTGLFMREGAACEECLRRGDEWKCVRYNCERSWLKSVAYAARNFLARRKRHYLDCVDRYVCLTHFHRNKLIEAGFPAERIVVIPNSFDPDAPAASSDSPQGEYVGFCGRISREKGVDLILEVARRNPDIPFRLAGSVREPELVGPVPENVVLTGHLEGDEFRKFTANARFFLLPSRCYEGFPMAILEAAAYSRPTIAPAHGGFKEIIENGGEPIGLLFIPGDADSLSARVRTLWDNPRRAAELGARAATALREKYSGSVVQKHWQNLTNSLLNH